MRITGPVKQSGLHPFVEVGMSGMMTKVVLVWLMLVLPKITAMMIAVVMMRTVTVVISIMSFSPICLSM